MLERLEPILKGVCAVLAALLLYQFVRVIAHSNPLAHLTIPALPGLPADTNAPSAVNATNAIGVAASAKSGTSTSQSVPLASGKGTNSSAARASAAAGTNTATSGSGKAGTNSVTPLQAEKGLTNSIADARSTNTGTNAGANLQTAKHGTNSAPDQGLAKGATNSPALAASAKSGMLPGARSGMPPMGMSPSRGPAGAKLPDLALPILARVDKITDSEILGQVIRPLPKALLGIAGNVAFLRAANGQTGLVKEGDELSGLKLLRIGTNRVLVEQDGKKEELTIFSGYGGDTLMPK
jgi:hypothetical protein